ncbi:MAG: hypothetical protein ACFE7R_06660 [Candidatus Hodarchaeota archaeon]
MEDSKYSSEDILPATRVIGLTPDRFEDWIRVHNIGNKNTLDYFVISKSDLISWSNSSYLSNHEFFLSLSGAKPCGTARLSIDKESGLAAINDFVTEPGFDNESRVLAETVLSRARSSGVSVLSSWLPLIHVRLSNMLNEFTFEPDGIRYKLEAVMGVASEKPGKRICGVHAWNKTYFQHHFKIPLLQLGCRKLDLYEICYHHSMKWKPRVFGSACGVTFVGYRSESDRRQGWLDYTLIPSMSNGEQEEIKDLITDAIGWMFADGVSEIHTEVDADRFILKPFTESGFEKASTLVEMRISLIRG